MLLFGNDFWLFQHTEYREWHVGWGRIHHTSLGSVSIDHDTIAKSLIQFLLTRGEL